MQMIQTLDICSSQLSSISKVRNCMYEGHKHVEVANFKNSLWSFRHQSMHTNRDTGGDSSVYCAIRFTSILIQVLLLNAFEVAWKGWTKPLRPPTIRLPAL